MTAWRRVSRSRSTISRPDCTRLPCQSRIRLFGRRSGAGNQVGDRFETGAVAHESCGVGEALRQRSGGAVNRLAKIVDRDAAAPARQGEVHATAHLKPCVAVRGGGRCGFTVPCHLDQPVKGRERGVGRALRHQFAEEPRVGRLSGGCGLDGESRVHHRRARRAGGRGPRPNRRARVFRQPRPEGFQHVRQRPFDEVEGLQPQRVRPLGVKDERAQRVEDPRAFRALEERRPAVPRAAARTAGSDASDSSCSAPSSALRRSGVASSTFRMATLRRGGRRAVEGDNQVGNRANADHGQPGGGCFTADGIVAGQIGEEDLNLGRRRLSDRHLATPRVGVVSSRRPRPARC